MNGLGAKGIGIHSAARPARRKPEHDADEPAEQRQHEGLDQKLGQHLAFQRADREPDADLAGALGHRYQHDVHDADAADEEADRGDRAEQRRSAAGRRGHGRDDLRHVAHREIILLAGNDAPPLAQQLFGLGR